MKFFLRFCAFVFLIPSSAFSALPFVTDDAQVSEKNQAIVEAYNENWRIPKKDDSAAGNLFSQYLGASYGVANNFEVTAGGLISYDFVDHSKSLMNPILQVKTVVSKSKTPAVPDFAISAAYVNKSGTGQYYDSATNTYLLGIATDRFFNNKLVIHVNSGLKSSYNIDNHKNLQRLHLGIAFDLALIDKIRLVAETFNGAPNSPRDSTGFFHSYQAGFRFIKSANLAFHVLYGSQPTFAGYDDAGAMTHRKTSWIQFGIRKSFDEVF